MEEPSPPKQPSREGDLFRPEAVSEQRDRWLGTVLIVPRLSHSLLTGIAAVIVAGILGLVIFGEYTRKARVTGWLAPEGGLIHIVAPQPGVLTQVHATEGVEVAAGAPLAVLSAELRSEAFGATQDEVLRQLRSRRDSMIAERARQQALFAQQAQALAARQEVMAEEQADVEAEAELQRARLALAEREVARQRSLRNRSIAVARDVQEAEADALDQALALQALERNGTTLARERLEAEAALAEAPLREAMRLAEIDRDIAALEQELAEAEAAREIVVVAPQAGTVTALQLAPGGSVGSEAPLMTLLPAGSKLEARLYGPSRAIGFVQPGQRVLLRYGAFPYQKFGQYAGIVRHVSRTTVSPAELANQGAALLETGEAVYRITVELAAQSATAYGAPVALQPGMQLEADVLIETRRLYEWVLDPLYSLTGRGEA